MTGAPAISVIVPAYGRPEGLRRLLAAIARCEVPIGGLEVIVVDDGSTLPLAPERPDGLAVQVIRQANAGPSAARNTGARAASGALLAFTDDDCEPDPAWLVTLAAATAEHPEAMVGGRSVCGLRGNAWAEASQALEDVVYSRANADAERATFLASKNLAIPAEGFAACGGFDESFRWSEDRELCARWLADGGTIVYEPGAVVRHRNPGTAGIFWRQHLGYGRGAWRFHRRPGAPALRPDLRDYAAFAAEPLRGPRRAGVPRGVILALVVLSQLASVVGYALAGRGPEARR
ncbi:unannotated protein [freshwater metagenome]|uniref:Unannotated protein n=1 Tax=freshwater metagenome TaxID=449393 RepID=A0A6J7GYM9_9ZZZZ